MAMFLEELMQVYEHTPRDPGVVILSGAGGMGKSKILRAMKAKAASMGFRYNYMIHAVSVKSLVHNTTQHNATQMLL